MQEIEYRNTREQDENELGGKKVQPSFRILHGIRVDLRRTKEFEQEIGVRR
jgi:hypothetical protein